MCGSMVDIQSPNAEIRQGKKKKKKDRNHGKNIMVCPITQGDHNQQTIVTSVHMHCAQFLQIILHRTDLIIFPVTLQTIIIAPMMSVSGKGDHATVNKNG